MTRAEERASIATSDNGRVQLNNAWTQPAGTYTTKAACKLRNDNGRHTEIMELKVGSSINITAQPREKQFPLNFLSANHIWVEHKNNEGWIRENAIGNRNIGEAINTYCKDKMRPLMGRGRGNQPLPDVQKYIKIKNGAMMQFLAGVNTRGASLDAVKKITANIISNELFEYSGKNSSELNFLSGTTNQGDCQTLSETVYLLMNEVLKMPGVSLKSKDNPFKINNDSQTLDGSLANSDGHWEFEHHYWLDVDGIDYDVLFGAELNRSDWVDL